MKLQFILFTISIHGKDILKLCFLFVIIERRFFLAFQVSYRNFNLLIGSLRLETFDSFVPLEHNEKILRIGISETRKSLLSVNTTLRCEQFLKTIPVIL